MRGHPELLHAERSLRAQAREGRLALEAGSLLACLTPGEPEPLLQVAVPTGIEPDDWGPSVTALLALQRTHGGVPRLEFMQELHPGLAVALERRGFRLSSSAAVMVASATELAPPPASGLPLRCLDLAAAPAGALRAFVEAQAQAFGMHVTTGYAFLPRLQAGLANGRIRGVALLDGDAPVSGATLLAAGGSAELAAELAGVWTAAERRRRGLAFAVCARLLADAQASGLVEVWLSAATEAVGLYHRLGFHRVGTQLNYAPPL